jgi:hypothetical protein
MAGPFSAAWVASPVSAAGAVVPEDVSPVGIPLEVPFGIPLLIPVDDGIA